MPIFRIGSEIFAFNVILFLSKHLIFPNLSGILIKDMERKCSFMFKLQHNEYYVSVCGFFISRFRHIF